MRETFLRFAKFTQDYTVSDYRLYPVLVREDIGGFFYKQMDISKTDLRKAIAYLDDAAKLYAAMPKPKHKWRASQIRQLTAKLKSKIENNGTK